MKKYQEMVSLTSGNKTLLLVLGCKFIIISAFDIDHIGCDLYLTAHNKQKRKRVFLTCP